ncbi:MAG: phosphate ABC transporter substrate-binding protein PstS [Cenarchaeum sp. SB0663_bin_5]|nr:phosphate ABC transporter substrate-binding protein PstS [Cenarchaeum sp. SB0663_bin_5]MYH03650.1 phosphate ABC transporter substrate-binding protein PstS [Cenarchaeum sp. SB0675_bin_21]MYL12029.1 phosphate ABC transporter substrate-binding protein PstS [Cenarchaeum sp. SB0669_bin_11]
MRKIIAIATIAVLLTAAIPSTQSAFAQTLIEASGATFAFPLLDLWRVQYSEVEPNIAFNYQSIGSGGGVKDHINKLGQFGATDAPLTDAEYDAAPGTITIPEMVGAISIAYNVDNVGSGLNISEEAICGIFLGEITNWSDDEIKDDNPGVELPNAAIQTVHRSDGSGTTFAFTSYLTKVCPEWDEQVGAAKSVPWPSGLGSPGNEGVAGTINSTPNSIGYVTLAYAFQNDMTVADLQNGDHTNFVPPSLDTASAASGSAAFWLPNAEESWRDVDLLAAPGFNSYPITSFSYLIIHPDLKDSADNLEHASAIADMIAWMITDGQQYSSQLLYVPIADLVKNIGLDGLSQVTYDGEPVYTGPTNVWVSDTVSDDIEDYIDTVNEMYEDDEIDQSTFLNMISAASELFELYEGGQITNNELHDALDNLLS